MIAWLRALVDAPARAAFLERQLAEARAEARELRAALADVEERLTDARRALWRHATTTAADRRSPLVARARAAHEATTAPFRLPEPLATDQPQKETA